MDPSTDWMLRNLATALLLPPGNGLFLLAAGGLLHRRPRWAWTLAIAGFLLLFTAALRPAAQWLAGPLEREALHGAIGHGTAIGTAQAIVVLGGGRRRDGREWGRETTGPGTLVRLRYAAKLARERDLPVLVSGGAPDGGELPEAETMRAALGEWGIETRWVENRSRNTRENAIESAALLKRDGVSTVILVSHATHLPRARREFERAGLAVVAAPTGFVAGEPLSFGDWLPQADAMRATRVALHEWLGLFWYRWGSG